MSVEISIYGGDAGQGGEAPEGNPLSVQRLMNVGDSITVNQAGPDGMALVRIHPLDDEAVTIAFSNGTAETFEELEYRILPLNSTLTMAGVPSAPRNLTATAGNGQAVLLWLAPATNAPPSTDYIVEYKLGTDGEWSVFADDVSSDTTATVTGLTNGAAYDFRVRAVNAAGDSEPSNVVTAKPAAPITFDPDAQAYFDAAGSANLTLGRKTAVNKFILGAKTAGIWDKLDRLNFWANTTRAAAVIDARDPSNLSKRTTVLAGAPNWSELGFRADKSAAGVSDQYSPGPLTFTGSKFAEVVNGNQQAALGFAVTAYGTVSGGWLIAATSGTGAATSIFRPNATGNQMQVSINGTNAIFSPSSPTVSEFPQVAAFTIDGLARAGYVDGPTQHATPTGGTVTTPQGTPTTGNFRFNSPGANGVTGITIGVFWSGGWMSAAEINALRDLILDYLHYVETPIQVDDSWDTNGWPSMSQGQSLVVGGSYDPASGSPPTTVAVAIEQDGATILAKAPATMLATTPGIWEAKVQSPTQLKLVASKNPIAKVYLNDSTTPIDQPFTPTVFAEIGDSIPSINLEGNAYPTPTDNTLDLAPKMQWSSINPTTGGTVRLWNVESVPLGSIGGTLDADGMLTKWADGSTGPGSISAMLPYYVYDERVNLIHHVTGLPAGAKLTITGGTSVVVVNNGTNGQTPSFRYTARRVSGVTAKLEFSLAGGPVDFKNFSIRPNDDYPADQAWPTSAREAKAGVKLVRFMQGDGINTTESVPGVQPNRNILPFRNMRWGSGFGLDVQVAMCNDIGCDFWYNIPRDATNAYVTAAATYIGDNLDPSLKVWTEYANERWNYDQAFIHTHFYVAARGYERNLTDTGATSGSTVKTRDVLSMADRWTLPYVINSSNLTSIRGINSGTIFPINMDMPAAAAFGSSGYKYVQVVTGFPDANTVLSPANCIILQTASPADLAKWLPVDMSDKATVWQDIPADTYMLLTVSGALGSALAGNGFLLLKTTAQVTVGTALTTANAQIVAGSGSMDLAQYRYGLVREVEINNIFDTVFGTDARTRVMRVHADRTFAKPEEIADRLAWIGNPSSKFDYYCLATYMGNRDDGYTWMPGVTNYGQPGAWFNTTGHEFPGWGLTEKGYFLTDKPRWAKRILYANDEGTGDVLNGPIGIAMRSDVAGVVADVHRYETAFRARIPGYVANSIKMCAYETGWAIPLVTDTGEYGKNVAEAKSAYGVLVDVPGTLEIVRHFYTEFADKVGGPHNQFVDMADVVNQGVVGIKRFSLQKDLYDTDAPMLAGYREAHGIAVN